MRIRNILLLKSVLFSTICSFFLYQLFRVKNFFDRLFIGRHIELKKNARISLHYKADVKLKNSKIILHEGAELKVGHNFGYFDRGGFNSQHDVCRIHLDDSTLHIHGKVSLFPGMTIIGSKGTIIIRGNTTINVSTIICKSSIEIGENCLFAGGVIVRDDDGHKHGTVGGPLSNEPKPVKIGNHCWLGQNSMVLKGVTLGDGCIIAAGSIVTKDVEPNSLVAGSPAKVIQTNKIWEA